ncbi:MAG: FkbM family methyltransferase [Pseudobutyrivibrio sp.]|uniref:FkbM family methyltransferase n=1 Tax=Pseudobutyrivibrio sp. TaxID=2014367 RepID=UPI0025F89E34|nr:FkbM family methyltransferase [Pseudobutyrivibrio sp.]MBQ6463056.1 FkbM family methyltransferase [Pseudobutyrivibrio sp.]
MMKAIVFGVGRNFNIYIDKIANNYEVVGITDNDESKLLKFNNGITINDIDTIEYDLIIITPVNYREIYDQLLNIGIPNNKLMIWSNNPENTSEEILGYRYWGQHCEDLILAAIFKMIGIKKPSYMNIGVNSPYECSNTAFLYLNGCRGIDIEANPDIIDDIKKYRPDDTVINVGVAGKEGTMRFYVFGEKSRVNTFSLIEVESRGEKPKSHIDLEVTTLSKILAKYCNNSFPDFLDIDIEGLDYEVLRECNLKENGPAVICVEVRKRDILKFDRLLTKYEYYMFCRIGENNIYVKNIYSEKLSHF